MAVQALQNIFLEYLKTSNVRFFSFLRICNQNLRLEFAIRICNQNFSIRICNQNLQSAATEVENLKQVQDQRLQTLVPTTAVIFSRSTNGNESCSSTLFNVGKSMGLLRQEAEFLNLFSCPLFRFVP